MIDEPAEIMPSDEAVDFFAACIAATLAGKKPPRVPGNLLVRVEDVAAARKRVFDELAESLDAIPGSVSPDDAETRKAIRAEIDKVMSDVDAGFARLMLRLRGAQ